MHGWMEISLLVEVHNCICVKFIMIDPQGIQIIIPREIIMEKNIRTIQRNIEVELPAQSHENSA